MNSWIQQLKEVGADAKASLIETAFWNKSLRPVAFRQLEKQILTSNNGFVDPKRPPRVAQDCADIMRALFSSSLRALNRQRVSRPFLRNGIRALMGSNYLYSDELENIYRRFGEKHAGQTPPWTIVISPTKACNLRCTGCYANADEKSAEHLEWDLFDRIITEAKTLWGIRFFTISGGEPFAYRSEGKTLLDMAAKHQDCFFMAYTNGTLIDTEVAGRIAEIGNLTPAISVEGMEAATDKRRGVGVFQRILAAMGNLRKARVPFGISLTATRLNAEEILSDAFIDYFFNEQQATYGWLFQYMPIGRGYTLDLLPTPEQRVWMWRRTWDIIRNREIFIADFWNCGTVSEGCIAGGKGYLYIDWNGKVMPCVFVPYSTANIRDIYRQGKTLDDVYDLQYFQGIRNWQSDYALSKEKPEEIGNWLIPCSFRDHYSIGRELINLCDALPENQDAADALTDEDYQKGMIAYDEALHKAFDPIWEQEYLRGHRCVPEPLVRIGSVSSQA